MRQIHANPKPVTIHRDREENTISIFIREPGEIDLTEIVLPYITASRIYKDLEFVL